MEEELIEKGKEEEKKREADEERFDPIIRIKESSEKKDILAVGEEEE